MIYRMRGTRIAITWTFLLAFVLGGTTSSGLFLCFGEGGHVGFKPAPSVSCESLPPYANRTGAGSRSDAGIMSSDNHCGLCVDVPCGQQHLRKTKTPVRRVLVIVRAANPGTDHYGEKPAQSIPLPSLTANGTLSFLRTIVLLI